MYDRSLQDDLSLVTDDTITTPSDDVCQTCESRYEQCLCLTDQSPTYANSVGFTDFQKGTATFHYIGAGTNLDNFVPDYE